MRVRVWAHELGRRSLLISLFRLGRSGLVSLGSLKIPPFRLILFLCHDGKDATYVW